MNVLMMVTWYTPQDAEKLEAGVFHNEQAIALLPYCNTAIYYPMDTTMHGKFSKKEEWGVVTYRSKYRQPSQEDNFLVKIAAKIQNYTSCYRYLKKIKKEFKPDVIHAHVGMGIGISAILLGKILRIPVIISEHVPVELCDFSSKINKRVGEFVYKNSRYNSCCSIDLKNKLQDTFPKCKFEVVYNGINPPKVDKDHMYYRKEDYINIGIVAVMYDKEIKGLQFLLPAIQKVVKSGKKVILHHIGGGEYLEYYIQLSKKLGIEANYIPYGQCDKDTVNQIVSEMDFIVSASLMEASGVSVMEAMMLGKPILGTNSGGVDSLVPAFAGKIVEKGSADALADGIVYMLEHFSMFDNKRIETYANENYDKDIISRKYVEIYKNICGKRK